ncbi:hypothetical protein K437DRAFT_47916 [Tilletiaria anomala UBC 951]|uniref:Uncharacterized protein n=1 Tax=Tilletiaria anomala (strain ATCC 24038 / CBS 436.72 / UBC 951) TaxID=1037660 RepID=A0A066VED8_TILAU|nr:uncharacterized protein K437DRAFT_47916 [Tilletiaria anomala UBC 951]KDN36930.1 hypothetical protein K437DRAFT_47916 [Tilletiaria anomala UBC 951]
MRTVVATSTTSVSTSASNLPLGPRLQELPGELHHRKGVHPCREACLDLANRHGDRAAKLRPGSLYGGQESLPVPRFHDRPSVCYVDSDNVAQLLVQHEGTPHACHIRSPYSPS